MSDFEISERQTDGSPKHANGEAGTPRHPHDRNTNEPGKLDTNYNAEGSTKASAPNGATNGGGTDNARDTSTGKGGGNFALALSLAKAGIPIFPCRASDVHTGRFDKNGKEVVLKVKEPSA